jgi:hypothetical protein
VLQMKFETAARRPGCVPDSEILVAAFSSMNPGPSKMS